MGNDTQVVVRVPGSLLKRIERLVRLVGKDKELSAFGRVSRSSVVRLALVRGVEDLEKQFVESRKG